MIKVNKGQVKIEGDIPTVLGELLCVYKSLQEEINKELIDEYLKMGDKLIKEEK